MTIAASSARSNEGCWVRGWSVCLPNHKGYIARSCEQHDSSTRATAPSRQTIDKAAQVHCVDRAFGVPTGLIAEDVTGILRAYFAPVLFVSRD